MRDSYTIIIISWTVVHLSMLKQRSRGEGGGDRHAYTCVGGAFKSDNEEPLFKFPNLGVLQVL